MTSIEYERLKMLQTATIEGLEKDLQDSRRTFLRDSFGFMKLAWEADAKVYERLQEKGSVAVGAVVEFFVARPIHPDIPALDTRSESLAEIAFAKPVSDRIIRIGFALPQTVANDNLNPDALSQTAPPDIAYISYGAAQAQPSYHVLTAQGTMPFIIPDHDGGSDAESFSSTDGLVEDTTDRVDPEDALPDEALFIAQLRGILSTWALTPLVTLKVTEDGLHNTES